MTLRPEDVFRSGRTLLRGGYPALVTALAAALLVLLLWPQSPRQYAAESVVVLEGAGSLPAAEVELLAWLKSDEVLRAAALNLRTRHRREMAALSGPTPGAALAAISQHLQLIALAAPDELPRLAIGCELPRRRASLAVAEELARQLAEHFPTQARRNRLANLEDRERQATAELKEAQATEERLQVELQGLRHAQLASAVANSAASPKPDVPAAPATDRGTSELARTLDALKLERDRLLEIYLPAHPQIQSLSAQISRLEESVRRLPRQQAAGSGGDHSALPQRGSGEIVLEWHREGRWEEVQASGQSELPSSDARRELAAAIRQAQMDLLAATHRRQKAEEAWQALAAERKQLESAPVRAWRIEPARITSTSGGNTARQQLAAALLAATMGGLGIGWLATRELRLTTAAELRASVALPVLATVDTAASEPTVAEAPSQARAAARLATRSAEVVLATFVLTLLAAIALDRGLVADLMHDPLATLGELVQRLI